MPIFAENNENFLEINVLLEPLLILCNVLQCVLQKKIWDLSHVGVPKTLFFVVNFNSKSAQNSWNFMEIHGFFRANHEMPWIMGFPDLQTITMTLMEFLSFFAKLWKYHEIPWHDINGAQDYFGLRISSRAARQDFRRSIFKWISGEDPSPEF